MQTRQELILDFMKALVSNPMIAGYTPEGIYEAAAKAVDAYLAKI